MLQSIPGMDEVWGEGMSSLRLLVRRVASFFLLSSTVGPSRLIIFKNSRCMIGAINFIMSFSLFVLLFLLRLLII